MDGDCCHLDRRHLPSDAITQWPGSIFVKTRINEFVPAINEFVPGRGYGAEAGRWRQMQDGWNVGNSMSFVSITYEFVAPCRELGRVPGAPVQGRPGGALPDSDRERPRGGRWGISQENAASCCWKVGVQVYTTQQKLVCWMLPECRTMESCSGEMVRVTQFL